MLFRLLRVPELWVPQVAPPSVVTTIVPVEPTAQQVDASGQEAPARLTVVGF